MEKISFKTLVKIVDGEVIQTPEIPSVTGATIDSRKVKKGDLFIPIKGERVDGHRFIAKAAEQGATVCLSEEKHLDFPDKIGVIYVTSCLEAMKAIAKYNRCRYELPVVAVTGSSGKTTTKDIIAAVLSEKFKTLKTEGNFNNEYGIPQTLFNLNADHEAAVIEMGMDHLKDISKSIDEVRPHISVITNIGTAHIEILKTQEKILQAKCEIFETMTENDIALLNGDDLWLNSIDEAKVPFQIVRVGIEGSHLQLKAENIVSSSQGLSFDALGKTWQFAYPGIHNVYNCLMAIWIGTYYQMDHELIQKGLLAFKPSGNRMDILQMDHYTVINDSYNANPDAMKAALSMLQDMAENRRKIAVLGDMLEMGEMEKEGHLEIGEEASKKADLILAVGKASKYYIESAKEVFGEKNCFWSPDAETAADVLMDLIKPDDIVLIKGSRGIHLEKIVDKIKGE